MQYIVDEKECFNTEAEFWGVYSDEHGKRLNVQRILDKLQGTRMGVSDRDASAALKFFNDDLSRADSHGYFFYKKSGTMRLMSKPATIARQWQKLLREHPEVAEAWSETLPDSGDDSNL